MTTTRKQQPTKQRIRTLPEKAPTPAPGRYQAKITNISIEDGRLKIAAQGEGPLNSTSFTYVHEIAAFKLDRAAFTTKVRDTLDEAPAALSVLLLGSTTEFKQGLVVGWLIGKGLDSHDFRSQTEWEAVIAALMAYGGDGWDALFA